MLSHKKIAEMLAFWGMQDKKIAAFQFAVSSSIHKNMEMSVKEIRKALQNTI